jgi:inorganic phosphate transporter, PiT family
MLAFAQVARADPRCVHFRQVQPLRTSVWRMRQVVWDPSHRVGRDGKRQETMSAAEVLAVIGALALAALLGTSDSPNAIAALVSGRTRSYRAVAAWSLGWHILGGIVAGTVVARTTVGLVHVSPHLLAPVLAAGCWSSVIFTWWTVRHGFPTSASVGLVGGLAGAGLAVRGLEGVNWGGVDGARLGGVLGVLGGILLAPVLAGTVALLFERVIHPLSLRLRRGAARPVRAGVWVASAAVALADGTNDGQKAMGVLAASLSGAAVLPPGGGGISWPVRVSCAVLLGVFTVVGGRQVVTTVARRLWRSSSTDDLAGQSSAAAVIFLAAGLGLPLSTSTVVTSARVGTGLSRRPRHLRRQQVLRILWAWLVTLPACGIAGALLVGIWRLA